MTKDSDYQEAMSNFIFHYNWMRRIVKEMMEEGYAYPIGVNLSPYGITEPDIHMMDDGEKGGIKYENEERYDNHKCTKHYSMVDGIKVFYLEIEEEIEEEADGRPDRSD